MTEELLELCQRYKLRLADTNEVYWFLAKSQEDEAIRYLSPLVGYDYSVAKKFVELYKVSECEVIEDGKQRIQNAIKKQFELHEPKCPTCSSTNVQKIGTGERAASIALFGIFSEKINKTFKCNNCGYTW